MGGSKAGRLLLQQTIHRSSWSSYVPVTAHTPRIEAHIHTDGSLVHGCNKRVLLLGSKRQGRKKIGLGVALLYSGRASEAKTKVKRGAGY